MTRQPRCGAKGFQHTGAARTCGKVIIQQNRRTSEDLIVCFICESDIQCSDITLSKWKNLVVFVKEIFVKVGIKVYLRENSHMKLGRGELSQLFAHLYHQNTKRIEA